MKHSHRKPQVRPNRFSKRTVIASAVAFVLLGTGLVFAFSRQKVNAHNSSPAKSPVNYITRQVGGQTVQIDPQTGQIKPLTREEAQRLAHGLMEMANQSTEGLKQVRQADGTVSLDLEGRFQNVTLARRETDGNVTQSCIDNPQAGAKFLGIDPQLVAPAEKTSSTATKPANQ